MEREDNMRDQSETEKEKSMILGACCCGRCEFWRFKPTLGTSTDSWGQAHHEVSRRVLLVWAATKVCIMQYIPWEPGNYCSGTLYRDKNHIFGVYLLYGFRKTRSDWILLRHKSIWPVVCSESDPPLGGCHLTEKGWVLSLNTLRKTPSMPISQIRTMIIE